MEARAAVAWAAKQPLEIEMIDVEGPREGEVLLKVIASGVCHTDAFTLSGDDPEGSFPCVLGHEGGCGALTFSQAGIVISVLLKRRTRCSISSMPAAQSALRSIITFLPCCPSS